LLDAAALTMLENAEPFPEPPPEVEGDNFNFSIPVVFAARMGRGAEEVGR
jgi:protein TonB